MHGRAAADLPGPRNAVRRRRRFSAGCSPLTSRATWWSWPRTTSPAVSVRSGRSCRSPVFIVVLGVVTVAALAVQKAGYVARRALLFLHAGLLAGCLGVAVGFGPFAHALFQGERRGLARGRSRRWVPDASVRQRRHTIWLWRGALAKPIVPGIAFVIASSPVLACAPPHGTADDLRRSRGTGVCPRGARRERSRQGQPFGAGGATRSWMASAALSVSCELVSRARPRIHSHRPNGMSSSSAICEGLSGG